MMEGLQEAARGKRPETADEGADLDLQSGVLSRCKGAHQWRVMLQGRVHAPQRGHLGGHGELGPIPGAAQGLLDPLQPGLHGHGLQRHALRHSPGLSVQTRLGSCCSCKNGASSVLLPLTPGVLQALPALPHHYTQFRPSTICVQFPLYRTPTIASVEISPGVFALSITITSAGAGASSCCRPHSKFMPRSDAWSATDS